MTERLPTRVTVVWRDPINRSEGPEVYDLKEWGEVKIINGCFVIATEGIVRYIPIDLVHTIDWELVSE